MVVNLRLGVLPMAAMLLLFSVLTAACSSDVEDAANGGADADASEPALDQGNSGNGGSGGADESQGSGNATLTIGDESWSFDNVRCGFSQEETFLRASFHLSAFGETAEGVRIELSAAILDKQEDGRYKGKGVSYVVSLVDAEDDENPTLNWTSITGLFGEVEPVILVEGKNVTADTTFTDYVTITGAKIPGTLQATCS